jgi:hypothetical protein
LGKKNKDYWLTGGIPVASDDCRDLSSPLLYIRAENRAENRINGT